MWRMSEPPRDLATSSVEELRVALERQRGVNTELRTVIAAQAELHQAELATWDAALAAKAALIAESRSQVAVLADRVAQPERRAGRDSSDSNQPPSSDSPYAKKPPTSTDRSLRGRSGRKPGRQPGALGTTLAQVADPDGTIVCAADRCQGCGGDLAGVPVAAEQARQVFEPPPPPPRPVVTEYRVQARVCPVCGVTSVGRPPQGWAGGCSTAPTPTRTRPT
jgi:transposase